MFFYFSTDWDETRGQHGYNNTLESMHPFFIAHGPMFKKGYQAPPFNNVDIYPLMCHMLEIEPYPNNGSLTNIMHILKDETGEEDFITLLTCKCR